MIRKHVAVCLAIPLVFFFTTALTANSSTDDFCLQADCRHPIPAPPQPQRVPIPAQILEPGVLGWGVEWGQNDRSSIAGLDEGSTWLRSSLGDSGLEMVFGVAAPQVIPFLDLRAQLLGNDWPYGPYLTLEAGADLLSARHIGLSLGAQWGPVSPFVAASVGHVYERDYLEGNAGLALALRSQLSLNFGVSRRVILEQRDEILANTWTLALDWHIGGGQKKTEPRHRRHRRGDADAAGSTDGWPTPPAAAAATAPAAGEGASATVPAAAVTPATGNDPCGFSATIDAFDPARWEARARCLDALGKPDDARQARAKAKELRSHDQDSDATKE